MDMRRRKIWRRLRIWLFWSADSCSEAVTLAQRLRSSALTPLRPSSSVDAISFCMLVGCSTAVCMHSWPCSSEAGLGAGVSGAEECQVATAA